MLYDAPQPLPARAATDADMQVSQNADGSHQATRLRPVTCVHAVPQACVSQIIRRSASTVRCRASPRPRQKQLSATPRSCRAAPRPICWR